MIHAINDHLKAEVAIHQEPFTYTTFLDMLLRDDWRGLFGIFSCTNLGTGGSAYLSAHKGQAFAVIKNTRSVEDFVKKLLHECIHHHYMIRPWPEEYWECEKVINLEAARSFAAETEKYHHAYQDLTSFNLPPGIHFITSLEEINLDLLLERNWHWKRKYR